MTKSEFLKSIFIPLHKEVYNFILSRTGYNKENTEDLFQEIMYKVWDKRDSYELNRSSKRTWLYQIVRNHLVDYYRRKRFQKVELDDAVLTTLAENSTTKWDNEIQIEKLIQLMVKLKTNDRELIQMRYINELTYQEISGVTGKTENVLKVAVHRALAKLRKLMKQ